MRCVSCGTDVGSTYRRCPACGQKFEARAGTAASEPAAQSRGVAPTVVPHAVAPAWVNAPPCSLPPPPSAKAFPLTIILVGAVALVGIAVVLLNWLTTQVDARLSAQFEGGWSQVSMSPSFLESSWLRKSELKNVSPMFELSRANGDVLYRGPAPRTSVDDTALGSKEVLAAKACIFASVWYSSERQSHCGTTSLEASPKRTAPINVAVSYPRGGAANLPLIAFQHELQRQVFGSTDQWATIRVLPDPVRLKVWVTGSAGDAVQLNIEPSKTAVTVDLRTGDGYATFNTAVLKAQAVQTDVRLQFQFHVSAAVDAQAYPPVVVVLEGKTAAERLGEVESMALRAARRIVGDHYGGGRDISAAVIDWGYDAPNRRYSAQLRFDWSGREVASNKYWVEGRLVADETGDGSQFELTRESDFPLLVRTVVGIKIKVGDVVKDVLAR